MITLRHGIRENDNLKHGIGENGNLNTWKLKFLFIQLCSRA